MGTAETKAAAVLFGFAQAVCRFGVGASGGQRTRQIATGVDESLTLLQDDTVAGHCYSDMEPAGISGRGDLRVFPFNAMNI